MRERRVLRTKSKCFFAGLLAQSQAGKDGDVGRAPPHSSLRSFTSRLASKSCPQSHREASLCVSAEGFPLFPSLSRMIGAEASSVESTAQASPGRP